MHRDRLEITADQRKDVSICFSGDFNSIRLESKRVGRNLNPSRRDVVFFDRFVRKTGLIEYSLQARKFTWYRNDGSCKCRIDRCFGNLKWLDDFLNISLRGGKNPTTLFLEEKVVDWGPKPFRLVNAWLEHPEFLPFVKEKWNKYEVGGSGGYVLREKLKLLREDVKSWHTSVFGNLENRIKGHRENIFKLDLFDDAFGLEEEEVIQRNLDRALLIQDLKLRNNALQQKAKIKWIECGDANSALFHRCIKGRKSRNSIHGLVINNAWSQDVKTVKDFVRDSFKDHFKSGGPHLLKIPNDLDCPKISEEVNSALIRPFSEAEVMEAMKSCRDFKSPGPDGFNPAFFRYCWDVLKGDIMRFLTDFHDNGKLRKGLNHSAPSYRRRKVRWR